LLEQLPLLTPQERPVVRGQQQARALALEPVLAARLLISELRSSQPRLRAREPPLLHRPRQLSRRPC
jgi:hypothetical protein